MSEHDGGRPASRHPRGGVTTTGTGTVDVVPDLVRARLGVQVTDADGARAFTEASQGLRAVRECLLADGVAQGDLRTASTTSWTDPGDEGGEGREPRRPRTTVQLTLEVLLRDLSTAGELVGRAVAAAGSVGRLEHTAFELADLGPAVTEARTRAFGRAVDAAEQLARLAGRALGPVLDVREAAGDEGGPGPRAFRAVAAAGPALDPGTQAVTVTLVVRHGWADPGVTQEASGPQV